MELFAALKIALYKLNVKQTYTSISVETDIRHTYVSKNYTTKSAKCYVH